MKNSLGKYIEVKSSSKQGPVNEIAVTEVRRAILEMQNHKGVGLPAELWKSLKGDGEVWLCQFFNNILKSEKFPDA